MILCSWSDPTSSGVRAVGIASEARREAGLQLVRCGQDASCVALYAPKAVPVGIP